MDELNIDAAGATLASASYCRLKLGAELVGQAAADWFLKDLQRSPFLAQADVDRGKVYLYGDETTAPPAGYAEFIRELTGHSVPSLLRPGYVLILEVSGTPTLWYAMTFGTGRHLLKDVIDIEAHREIARHQTIPKEPEREILIKQLRTKEPGLTSLTNEKRASRATALYDFDVDLETEIVDELLGRPQNEEKFGRGISGGQSVTIRTRVGAANLLEKVIDLEAVLTEAREDAAESVAGMRTVKNRDTIDALDERLAAMVRDPEENDVALSLPLYVSSGIAHEVRFSKLGRAGSYADTVSIDDYRQLLINAGKLGDVDVDFLKDATVKIDGEQRMEPSLYRCLAAYVELDGQTYVHEDRFWYRVPADIQESVNEEIGTVPLLQGLLPAQRAPGTEKVYNEAQNRGEWLMLDRQLVQPFRGESRIEICDLLTLHDERLTFVHVKRDFSSSQLSHLFNQGRVSALLMAQADVRERYVEQIRASARSRGRRQPSWMNRLNAFLGGGRFNPARISIVYAIIGNWPEEISLRRLPFFSRVTLLKAKRELRGREFNVAIAPIAGATLEEDDEGPE